MASRTNDIKNSKKPSGRQRSHLIPTLEGLRNKLLDLTTRNSLLNLSLSDKRTRRLIRFVHSDLQGTLSALCSGTTALPLLPLPDPPAETIREIDDAEFEAALHAARLEDPLYQQILADSAGDKGLSPALASAEDRLRSQVREALEQSGKKRRAAPNLAKWAESQGVNPSYELPCKSGSRARRSSGIQTLLLGARLERVAEAIRKQAISSIEETGNNILYLTFGGLSWKAKDKDLFAPLVLLPVELINAGARGRERRYTLKAVDDVPLENVTLRERLKRDFSVELPALDAQDKGLELNSYLEAVAAAVGDNENWSVQRFMNLSLFSFSGLGLYEDLEPEVIQKSKLVRQILAAESGSSQGDKDSVRIAEDESVDKPGISDKVPVLITQADASQFAAIADAMNGRSMVIEGPPGTGKSQTITNIIANALYAGKRVLFVAEKKVALDVVYTRLSEAGLRDYCLRIASDKVNKRDVYSELGDRLRLACPATKDRDPTFNAFKELRQELNEFSNSLNRGFGTDRKSFQALIWEELYLRQQFKTAKVDLSEVRVEIQGAGSLTRANRDRYCQVFEQLAALKTELPMGEVMGAFSPLGANPEDALGREKLIESATQWKNALVALSAFQTPESDWDSNTLEQMRQAAAAFSAALEKLPQPLEPGLEELVPLLASIELQERAEVLLTTIEAERRSTEKLQSLFIKMPAALPDARDLNEFLVAWRQWRLGDTGMPVAVEDREALAQQLAELDRVIERIEIVLQSSSDNALLKHATFRQLEALLGCLEQLAPLPAEVLRTRQSKLWTSSPNEIGKFLDLQSKLERQGTDLGILPDHPVLQYDSATLKERSRRLKQAVGLGLGHVLKDDEGVRVWRSQHDHLDHCVTRVSRALTSVESPCELTNLSVQQLLEIPGVLLALQELPDDALSHRSGPLWDSSSEEIEDLRKASEQIQLKEEALERASLEIPEGVAYYVIQSAAKKLESTPWILQGIDGDYSRAVKLAKRVGATGKRSEQAKSLRDVASLVELKAKFPEGRLTELCHSVSSLEEAARVVSQFEKFKRQLQSSSQSGLLPLVRSLTSKELTELQKVYENDSLSKDLGSLVENTLLGLDALQIPLSELALRLRTDRERLELVESLGSFVKWGISNGIAEPDLIAEWLENVAAYITAVHSFPSKELLELCEDKCTQNQAIVALQAFQAVRSWLEEIEPLGGADDFFRSIPLADINGVVVLLRDQLLMALRGLSHVLTGHGIAAETLPVAELVQRVKDASHSFECLVRQHAELGLVKDLTVEALVSAPIDLELHQKRQAELADALVAFQEHAGDELRAASTDALGKALAWIHDLRNRGLPSAMECRCLTAGSSAWIREQNELSKRLGIALQAEFKAASDFLELAQLIPERLPGQPSTVEACPTADLRSWLTQVCSLSHHLSQWVRLHELIESLPSEAERKLAAWLMENSLPETLWPDLYRWNIIKSRLSGLLQAKPQLQALRASDQVARRKRFAKTEDDLRTLDRSEVIAAIHRDPDELPQGIDAGLKADFTEMGLIRNESVKRIKHRPLRHLFQFAGEALRGLKPCWMMSPATVASLLPRGDGEDFDLVVIDEASQMSPERALGVISRAKQCVVVGDPQQLPPTSLFQRSVSWDEGDDAEEVDIDVLEEESILDLSSKAFQPTRRLKWHYRSRNGSLIAFSNKHFYDDQLVVFPACHREFAITRHLVDEPRYRKGVNEPEVRDVCDIVLQQLEIHPERTLGVVAMNEGQAEAIAEQLDDLAFHHDELRRRLDLRDNSESLFVKPLEKVQGDERDTIVISTTYGPSEPGGTVALRFGLLNRSSGHRRLNVLFTRAKHAIELVTSMQSTQLRLPATAGPGLLAFRDYLRYVEKSIDDSESELAHDPQTPFEKVVFELLTQQGIKADCRVGFANYFIDFAIRHPEAPDHYLLALEGDGANYHSARAARDRDKYRQAVLEGLGWHVYKIWSTDWFENPESELRKLIRQIKTLSKSAPVPVSRSSRLRTPQGSPARPRSPSQGSPSESTEPPEPDPEPEPAAAPPDDVPPCAALPPAGPAEKLAAAKNAVLPAGAEAGSMRMAHGSADSGSEPAKEGPQGPQHSPDLALAPPLPTDAPPGLPPVPGRRGLMPSVVLSPSTSLSQGCVVHCRSHRWLVEEVEPPELEGGDTVVRMACLDDDANGQRLEVFWEREVDAQVLGETTWDTVGQRGFDRPQVFGSYLNTLRWNCVTSTDPGLFQAPLRAGIDVKPYQLEPLRKALRMPRVSLFIADDVGLGKTIEAGLIMRELLLRQKVHRVVVVAPPSVVLQWKGEMESRFGLGFAVMDRQYISEMRRQRGWGINPWATHTRFILSQALVRDEAYAGPLRDWLGDEGKQALLILDEAHNAAPASGSKFAIDSKLTRSIRDLAGRFEHKLFLSATPHNGHSNSFSALLEILDPTRFCRGVAVRKQDLEDVMVRRLKEDLRQIGVELPLRLVTPEVIDDLPADTPELKLAELLTRYRELRNQRLLGAGKRERAAENLVISNLQKRLLSSIAAFHRTLQVHMNTLEKRAAKAGRQRQVRLEVLDLLQNAIDGDDERAEGDEEELLQEADAQHEAALSSALEASEEEWQLLRRMQEIAEGSRYHADSRVQRLEVLIREHLCPGLGQEGAPWNGERLLIFTEYADTKDWLERRVRELIAGTDQAEARIATFHGGIRDERREAIKRSFNSPPEVDPLRILIATDAAREGVNLQNHCRRLVHFDVPWNPGRMEQRNGRIDRTLQRSAQVYCHYFVLPQRPEDTVLDTVVRKTDQIRQELGCLPPVVIRKLNDLLAKGINPTALAGTIAEIEGLDQEEAFRRTRALLDEELEGSRERKEELEKQVGTLERYLERSRKWLNFTTSQFRDALNTSLQLTGERHGNHELALRPRDPAQAVEDPERAIWEFPAAEELPGGEVVWGDVLDALRPPRQPGQKLWQWRQETQLQPVVFRDPQEVNADRVHLHLEHPLVTRLLNRFLMRGFQSDALSHAAVLGTTDDTAKLIVLARLSLYGHGASRLHDEVLAVAAEWDPADPGRRLRKLSVEKSQRALADLEAALQQRLEAPEGITAKLQGHLSSDIAQLREALDRVVDERREEAAQKLAKRAEEEAARFIRVLEEQRKRITSTRSRTNDNLDQLLLDLGEVKAERRQLEDNRKYWEKRLRTIDDDLAHEPARIRRTFELQTHRVEPAGAIYLWPQEVS